MGVVENIRKYKKKFEDLTSNSDKNFGSFLQERNLNIIEFLIQIGLNPTLVKSFTYEELEQLSSNILESVDFPIISYSPSGKDLTTDAVSLYNKEKGVDLVITANSIEFNDYVKEESESRDSNNITVTSFLTTQEYIKRKNVHIIASQVFSNPKVRNVNARVNHLEIEAEEMIYDLTGRVVNSGSYEISINAELTNYVYGSILSSLMHNSITSGAYSIVELIASGKISRKDVDIKLNIEGLQRK